MAACKRQRTSPPRPPPTAPPTDEELRDWRAGVGGGGWVHMNAAGCSPTHDATHRAVTAHLELEREVGGYAAHDQLLKTSRDAHEALGDLLGCDADEIALAESCQAAWCKAFYSMDFRDGDRIVCGANEYGGNAVAFLQQARRRGVKVEVIPVCDDGVLDLPALRAALEPGRGGAGRTLVALTHVATDDSAVQPAAEVGRIAKAAGATYLLDACQAIGQIPVDVRELQCDFACGTGRKWLRGPRGTGFLYARRGALPDGAGGAGLVGEPPIVDHFGAAWTAPFTYEVKPGAQRYEMWEASMAARAGLAVAADVCRRVGLERIRAISSGLADRLRAGLATVPAVTLHRGGAASRCAIVLFHAEKMDSWVLAERLASRKIGAAVAPGSQTFVVGAPAAPTRVRVSPTYFNTEAEVDMVVAAIREILN